LAAACLLLSLAFAAASPAAAQDDWLGRDKALHFGISAALSASAYGVSAIWLEPPAYRTLIGASTALVAGAAKEVWDAAGHGDPSGKDFTWDLVGAVTGAGLALAVDLVVRRIRRGRGDARPAALAPPALVVEARRRGREQDLTASARREPRYCPLRLSSSSSSSDSSLSRSPISTTE
jgi:putative lipoprotein